MLTTFSKTTGPNCMKFSGMICHHPRTNRLDFGIDQVKGLKNYWTELHEIFRDDLPSSKDQSIRFWSRLQKGQKSYFCHKELSFRPLHMKPTPKCSLFISLSSDMVTIVALAKLYALLSARSSFIYLLVSKYVCYQLFSKTTEPNCMKFSGMICHHPRTNQLDFGSNQVKGQGHEKVKNVIWS